VVRRRKKKVVKRRNLSQRSRISIPSKKTSTNIIENSEDEPKSKPSKKAAPAKKAPAKGKK